MKYFFNNEETGESISDAIAADFETVILSFNRLSENRDSFLGLIDIAGRVLQFAWEDHDKWLVDIPNMQTKTAKQKFATKEECIEIIKTVYIGVSFDEIDGLKETSIG